MATYLVVDMAGWLQLECGVLDVEVAGEAVLKFIEDLGCVPVIETRALTTT